MNIKLINKNNDTCEKKCRGHIGGRGRVQIPLAHGAVKKTHKNPSDKSP